jgi:broad specificity phosphatase PhoE
MLEFNKRSFRFNVPLVSGSINLVSNKYTSTTDPQLLNTDYYFTGDYTHFINEITHMRIRPPKSSVLLFRHGARDDSSTGVDGKLNDRGITYSTDLGDSLSQINAAIKYSVSFCGTEYYRTRQTCSYIAKGLGLNTETNPDDWMVNVPNFPGIIGNYIMGETTDWNTISQFCYNPNNRAYITNKAKSLIENVLDKVVENNTRWNIMISHDQLLAPMIAYALNFDTSKMITSDNWVRFLSGIGIILYYDNTYELVPVIGNDPWSKMH